MTGFSNDGTGDRAGPVALVTGASRGLGEALATALAEEGWALVLDARGADELDVVAAGLRSRARAGAGIVAVAGDVGDPDHRDALAAEVARFGRLDLLVNNASILGPSPPPSLADYPLDALRQVYEVNVVAPLALAQAMLPWLRRSRAPRVLNVTSDASIEAYPGWGGYGSAKAALDLATRVWAAEQEWLRSWAVDPGDMRTRLHQEAFPGEDISDRPAPATVVPRLLALIASDRPSGRIRAADVDPAGDPDRAGGREADGDVDAVPTGVAS
jgi:NAD(P)-dependent dehydrogenase (short-subunit alcohol dehydrogenase family)